MESSMHTVAQRPIETDEFADNVSQELLCVICGSVLIDPRVLRCQHCFCLRCLFATVMHDRGSHITVHCAYRCPEVTVTEGDIRALPRNTVITNLAHLVRDRDRKKRLHQSEHHPSSQARIGRASAGTRQASPPLATSTSPDDHAASSPLVTDSHHAAASAAEQAVVASHDHAECEWCGSSSSPVTWCAYCLSQVCTNCRGVFEDHTFLCTELRTQKSTAKTRATEAETAGEQQGGDGARDGESVQGETGDESARGSLPFFFPACTVELLLTGVVHADRSSTQREPLTLTVESARPIRLSCELQEVCYTHDVFGPLCSYGVVPDGLTPFGKTVITPAEVRWGTQDRGTTSLLFASNVIELAGRFLQTLSVAHAELEQARLELKSVARRAFIRHNLAFQAVVLHLASQYRILVKIVFNCALPCLERGRAMEGLMGDVVVSQFYQQWSQGSPMERKAVQDRAAHFLQTEMKLCASMDDMIEKLGKQCDLGLELLDAVLREVSACMRETIEAQEAHIRNLAKCDHAQRRLAHGLTTDIVRPSHQARVSTSDPIFNAYADRTFTGQWRERQASIGRVRQALVTALLHLSTLRHWVWDYTNTTVRDCGMSPADQTELIEKEETMQRRTDQVLASCASRAKRTYAWEVLFVHFESTSTLPSLHIVSAVCEYETSNLHAVYARENTLSLFAKLRDLREYLLQHNDNPAYVIQSRTFQRQEEIIDVMKTVICECMTEQDTSMRIILSCEENEGDVLDVALAAHVVPATEARLPERDTSHRSNVDVLRDLLTFTNSDIEELCAQIRTPYSAVAADQYIRELALQRSATFGAFLIDAARGLVHHDDDSEEQMQRGESALGPNWRAEGSGGRASATDTNGDEHLSRGDAAVGARSTRSTPFLRSAPLTPAVVATPADASGAAGTSVSTPASDQIPAAPPLNAREDPLQLPVGALGAENVPDRNVRHSQTRRILSASSFSSQDSVSTAASEQRAAESPPIVGDTGLSTANPDPEQSERAVDRSVVINEALFAASDETSPVARIELTPKASDPLGYEKAVRIFARHYHFSTVETRTTRAVPLELPFFEGVVRVASSSGEVVRQHYLVDAQTGQAYIQESDGAKPKALLTARILTSPVFVFAVLNVALHPLLKARSTRVG